MAMGPTSHPGTGAPAGGGHGLAPQELPQPVETRPDGASRILVTGADGFIGRHLIPRLISRGHEVRALARALPTRPGARVPGVEWRIADLTDRETLAGIAEGCNRIVHLAGRFEARPGAALGRVHGTGTRNLVWELRKTGMERLVYVSTLGASPDAGPFFRSKFEAEDVILSSTLDFVILRPSVVYGPGDHFTRPIVRLLDSLPVFPVMGDGTFMLQPLAVEDMVDVLTQAVEREELAGRTFALAGPETLSFVRIVRILGEAIGRPRPVIPLPARFAVPAAAIADRFGLPSPFTRSQLDILQYGSVLPTTDNPVRTVFRLKPLTFADAVTDYLEPGDV